MFSQRLKELREEHGYSVRELADLCDISKSAISLYEQGKRKPKIEALEAIADIFNVDMAYLVGESDIRNAHPIDLQLFAESEKLTGDEQKWLDFYRFSDDDTRRMMVLFMSVLSELDANGQKAALKRFLSLSP